MRKIKKKAKKQRHQHNPDDLPSKSAAIIKDAIEQGSLDIMNMDFGRLPGHVIETLSTNEGDRFNNDQMDTAIVIYNQYLQDTQDRTIRESDLKDMELIISNIIVIATMEKAKRIGRIKGYTLEPHIFDPNGTFNCDFGDNKFFQGADAFRMIKDNK